MSRRAYLLSESTIEIMFERRAVAVVPHESQQPLVVTSCGYNRNPSKLPLLASVMNRLPPSHNCFSLLYKPPLEAQPTSPAPCRNIITGYFLVGFVVYETGNFTLYGTR